MVIFHNYVSLPEGSPIDSDWRLNVYEKHVDFMGIFYVESFFKPSAEVPRSKLVCQSNYESKSFPTVNFSST
jgi:hypothetical protein